MVLQNIEFKNILVVHFGQLGDVVLGLPALYALRERFAESKITLMVGKPTSEIAKLAKVADEYVIVDRVELRDSNKLWSIWQSFKLIRDIRRREFDFVIDLNSLYETNLVGFLSGAKVRLFENRERRSIDFFSNFPVKPPVEDKRKHHTDRYLSVLEPLGILNAQRTLTVAPPAEEIEAIRKNLELIGIENKKLIGLFLGAGHPSRRWGIDNFCRLARELSANSSNQVLVLIGPEERELRAGLEEQFGNTAVVVDEMSLVRFYTLLSRLDVLVTGDTGPMHLGALAGTGIVLLSEVATTQVYRPLTSLKFVLEDRPFAEITPDQVREAVGKLLI